MSLTKLLERHLIRIPCISKDNSTHIITITPTDVILRTCDDDGVVFSDRMTPSCPTNRIIANLFTRAELPQLSVRILESEDTH